MVVIFSIFFLLVDNVIAWFIKTLMGLILLIKVIFE